VLQVVRIPSGIRLFWSPLVEGVLAASGRAKGDMWKAFGTALEAGGEVFMKDVLPFSGLSRMVGRGGLFSEPEPSRVDPGVSPTWTDYGKQVLEALFGAAASSAMAGGKAVIDGISNGEAIPDLARRATAPYVHRGYEPGYGGAQLFPNEQLPIKVAMNDPTSTAYNDKFAAMTSIMKATGAGLNPDYGTETLTGEREGMIFSSQQWPTQEASLANTMARQVKGAMDATGLTSRISDKRMQLEALDANNAFDPATRRTRENEVRRELRALYDEALDYIERSEEAMSQQLGRQVEFTDLVPQ
jgi:hypothetical protein